MEKRISYRDYQSVKSVAKAIDPKLREAASLEKKIAALTEELNTCKEQISFLEAGIVKTLGFHVTDAVKKVIEPTGKTDAKGKPVMQTKYIPTDNVAYDADKKQYVITLGTEPHPVEGYNVIPPTTQDGPGSDFDADKEAVATEETPQPEEELGNIEGPAPVSPAAEETETAEQPVKDYPEEEDPEEAFKTLRDSIY